MLSKVNATLNNDNLDKLFTSVDNTLHNITIIILLGTELAILFIQLKKSAYVI